MNEQPPQSRPLPHHELHRRTMLAAIETESSRERASATGHGWLPPVLAAAAVLIAVIAGIGVHSLLGAASQPVSRPTAQDSPAPRPSGVGGGELSVTEKYTVTAPVSNVIVNDAVGSVSVTRGSGSGVSVTARIYYRTGSPSISRTVSGQTLTLGYSSCGDCGVGFTVTVPREASVTINVHTGAVSVADLAGDVSISDDIGMVSLANLTGDVSVQDGAGNISGTGLSAARSSFRNHNGMIDVAFTTAPRQLSAVTDTGMVSVRVPSGVAYRVNASSGLGAVNVSVPQSPAATRVITATTGTGMVSVSSG